MTPEFDKTMDHDLEAFFQAARDESPDPSADLMARILADAYDVQDQHTAETILTAADPVVTTAPRGVMASILRAIGGWPALAGLATATVAGVWIGYNPPAVFDTLTLDLLDSSYGISMGSVYTDTEFLLTEG